MSSVIKLLSASPNWTEDERIILADIQGALLTEGIETIYETSISDSNEPWTVFYETNGGSANGGNGFVVHVARSTSRYLILWPDGTHTRTFFCAKLAAIIRQGWRQHAGVRECPPSIASSKVVPVGYLH
jgi:hypothetical protein